MSFASCRKVQIQVPQLRQVETAGISAEGARAVAESTILSLAASESDLQDKVEQLARLVENVNGEVARMCQDCGRRVMGVVLERYGLPVHLYATAPQLEDVSNLFTAAHERLNQRRGRMPPVT